MPEDTNHGPPPLWKQILGAAIGGGLALALYYGYEFGKPKLLAYLTVPVLDSAPGNVNIADKDEDQEEAYDRIAARAREIAEKFGTRAPDGTDPADYVVTEPEPAAPPLRPAEPLAPPPADRPLAGAQALADLYEGVAEEASASAPVPVHEPVVVAEALPQSGFPAIIVAFGAGIGGAWMRRKRISR